jgi:hypothetical protein
MTEQEQRAEVVRVALEWKGTSFQHSQRIKGVAADCETFLCGVYEEAGVFVARDIPFVPAQWFLNTREELYLNYLSKYATEYSYAFRRDQPPPQPGDIVCVKHRWVHSHAAIVVKWPMVIHCHPPAVMMSDVFFNPAFVNREMKFFNPWNKPVTEAMQNREENIPNTIPNETNDLEGDTSHSSTSNEVEKPEVGGPPAVQS